MTPKEREYMFFLGEVMKSIAPNGYSQREAAAREAIDEESAQADAIEEDLRGMVEQGDFGGE